MLIVCSFRIVGKESFYQNDHNNLREHGYVLGENDLKCEFKMNNKEGCEHSLIYS